MREGLRQRQKWLESNRCRDTQHGTLSQDEEERLRLWVQQGDVLRALLLSQKVILPAIPLPDPLIGQKLRYIAMHEAGHALGLRHQLSRKHAVSVR